MSDQKFWTGVIGLIYLGVAEIVGFAPYYPWDLCLVEIQNEQLGEQAHCAAFHEMVLSLFSLAVHVIDQYHDAVTALATIFIALFTLTLWKSTAGLRKFAEEQSRDMKASIATAAAANEINRENMVASQRAWLAIEDVKLKYPTKFYDEGVQIGLNVTIKNIGQTPATSVWVEAESHFDGNEAFMDAEKRFKAKMRGHFKELGSILFAQDTLVQGLIYADGKDKIEKAIRLHPKKNEKQIGITIFVAVIYRIKGDDAPHLTHSIYSFLNIPLGTEVPNGQLVEISHMPFHQGEAD